MPQELDTCLCAVFNNLANPVKQNCITLLQTIKVLLQVSKANMNLYNIDYADQAKLLGLQTTSQIYHTLSDPFVNTINSLNSIFLPWADCPPANTVTRNLKKANDYVAGPTKKLDYEIAQLKKAMDEKNKKIEFMQNAINFIDDLVNTLQNFCK
jgi:hypothetical protein